MWGLNWAKSLGGEGRKGTLRVHVLVCVSSLCADPLLYDQALAVCGI